MILAGIEHNSLIDYPGKVACVVFLTGCNFTCPYCHNPDLARGRHPDRICIEDLLRFLKPRRLLLDGVVITGGEPTLAPGLAELCRAIREVGLAVKLDTNGSRPEVLAHLMEERLVDYIAMDLKTTLDGYAPVLTTEAIAPLIAQSIALILTGRVDYEFRTTGVRSFVDDQKIVAMAQAIQGARRYILQPFRQALLLRPDFFGTTNPSIPPRELKRLHALAAPWVQQCLIRH
jgi:pyruvate formate lyase activating enzyme